jgi:hypothetical protein
MCRRIIVAAVTGLVGVLAACSSGGGDGAPAGAVGDPAPTEEQASICGEMAQDAVERLVGTPLEDPPVARLRGARYSCRYENGEGVLRLTVDDVGTVRQARAQLEEHGRSPDVLDRLTALGDGGFEMTDGSIVLAKDQFVLTVDPNGLAAGVAKRPVSLGVTVAVMDCW